MEGIEAFAHWLFFAVICILIIFGVIDYVVQTRQAGKNPVQEFLRISASDPSNWTWIAFLIAPIAGYLAHTFPALRVVFAVIVPGAYLAWAFATLAIWLQSLSSVYNMREYIRGAILGVFMFILIAGHFYLKVRPLLTGFNWLLWVLAFVEAWMISPFFLRYMKKTHLAGFRE